MRNLYFPLLVLFLMLFKDSPAQYPFYFSSGNFNPPNSWTQANAVRMGTVANTNIQVTNATAIGNCYFRFYSALSGGTVYESNSSSNVLISVDTPFALQLSGGYGMSFYFPTVNLTDNYIFKTDGSGSPGNTRCAVIHLQGPIDSIVSISQFPAGDVYPGEDVTVNATLSGAFNTGQGAYLRFTTDGWASSTVIEMTGSGISYTATIPGAANASGTDINYYVFTSGSGLPISHTDADLMTINLYNNNFNNFNYIVSCPFTLPNPSFEMTGTDKARYNPGDIVSLNVKFTSLLSSGMLRVKYWHLGDSVGNAVSYGISGDSVFNWTWTPPAQDYSGYVAQLQLLNSSWQVIDSTSISIDVSSAWNRFPRYGFLSFYPQTDSSQRQQLFNTLNRYHLNGLQFYDVNHEHHMPLAGTVANPDTVWTDIANRETYMSTVMGYINLAHSCNMKAMNYNLIYGAYTTDAVAQGVQPQWGIYTDQAHTNPLVYTLPATWASNLQVENPADTNWQDYITAQESNLFQVFPYDGWHVDQLGSQGTVYDYYGNNVDLTTGFAPMLQKAKTGLNIHLVMNAVTNYGQQQIATAPVDFLYTEVWPPYQTYNDLVTVIANNTQYNGSLATVLAAYMDRGISNALGQFNTPAVLLTDATIFAAGGDHIEMGEHMLGNEYYPNNNLSMPCALQQSMISYYDFMTGYENLLRDSVSSSAVTLQTTGGIAISTTAATGSIWYMSKQKTNTQIFHLINLANANTIDWNDPSDNQTTPNTLTNIALAFIDSTPLSKLYYASPDQNNGLPLALPFTQIGGVVNFSLPQLSYWTMIVAQTASPVIRYVKAEPDYDTVLQASIDTLDVRANDTIVPTGDSACISIVSGSSAFSILDCSHIIFYPDSTFTGKDTCYYALCDTSGVCDTTIVVVMVDTNYALLPVVGFKQDTAFPGIYPFFYSITSLFQCNGFNLSPTNCFRYRIVNTSTNYDSLDWEIEALPPSCDSPLYYHTDTTFFEEDNTPSWNCGGISQILVCLTAYNEFGSVTYCDTSCVFTICEGINEIPFASFDVYPNPFSTDVNLDINSSISGKINISVSDALGRKAYDLAGYTMNSGKQTITLPLADQPDGLYFWSIDAVEDDNATHYRQYGKIVKQ